MENALCQANHFADRWDTKLLHGYTRNDDAIHAIYDHRANRRLCKRPLSLAEIAIYAGHRKAWQTLLDEGHEQALLLEDDFAITDPGPLKHVTGSWAKKTPPDHPCDIVKFFDFERHRPRVEMASLMIGDVKASRWKSPTAGTVAYIFTRDAAEKMLRREKIFRPVDEDMKYFWELDINVWSVRDGGVAESSVELGGSLVDGEREDEKSRRPLRSLYGNVLTAHRKIATRVANARFIRNYGR
ncbi:MAG: glycosyltransferase family 25 protein [Pseudomonadota bacterium]